MLARYWMRGFLTITDTELETMKGKSGRGHDSAWFIMDKLVETVRLGMLNGSAMAQSVTSFLPHGPGLNHNSLNVGFVVGMVVPR
jgi:hypothetical protein